MATSFGLFEADSVRLQNCSLALRACTVFWCYLICKKIAQRGSARIVLGSVGNPLRNRADPDADHQQRDQYPAEFWADGDQDDTNQGQSKNNRRHFAFERKQLRESQAYHPQQRSNSNQHPGHQRIGIGMQEIEKRTHGQPSNGGDADDDSRNFVAWFGNLIAFGE